MKKILQLCLLCFAAMQAYGQQDPMYSQYMFNMLAVNPAYAGSREVLSTTLLYRRQWVGIEGAPETVTFSADMPIKKKQIGLGFNLTDDRLGIIHTTGLNLSYAYRLRVSDRGMLSMGLQGGFTNYRADYGSVDPSQNSSYQQDVAFSGGVSEFLPNVGGGLWFATDRMYIGFSIPKLLKNEFSKYDGANSVEGFENRQNYHYFLGAGYVIGLSDVLKLKPSALLKVVHGSPLELDVNANLWIHDAIGIGLSYRTADAMVGMIELQATPQLRVGYAYDYSITRLQNYNSGTHEIMVRYEFGFDKGKILSPRYF